MIRNLKVLGLAITAVLAISAVGASAASAADFHSEAGTTEVEGTQTTTHVFTTDPGKVTCKIATFAGTQSSETASEITITPTYKECTLATIFGNIAVTVDFKGCDYLFTSNGTTHIVCPHTPASGETPTKQHGPVTVSGPGCTVTVPAQTVGGITYTNNGSGASRDINVDVNTGGIKYSYSGFTCGSGTNTTNGTYTGTATVDAAVGIWWE